MEARFYGYVYRVNYNSWGMEINTWESDINPINVPKQINSLESLKPIIEKQINSKPCSKQEKIGYKIFDSLTCTELVVSKESNYTGTTWENPRLVSRIITDEYYIDNIFIRNYSKSKPKPKINQFKQDKYYIDYYPTWDKGIHDDLQHAWCYASSKLEALEYFRCEVDDLGEIIQIYKK